MVHQRLGDGYRPRKWYDQAVPWMEKNRAKDVELVRFRDEATALLEVNEKKD
jgi:hypothetical protein